MRIAIDARPLTSDMTGIGRYAQNILSQLFELSPEHEWFLYAHRPLIINLPDKPNIHIRTGNLHRDRTSTLYAQTFFPMWAYKDKIDIFWSPRHHLPIFLSSKIKKFITIHDVVWKRYPETMTRLGWFLEYLLMPISVKLSDHVLAVSDFTKNEIIDVLSTPPDKITVTPLAPTELPSEVEPELPPILNGKKFFLFVGTLEPRKNLNNLLGAFSEFCKKNNDYQLVIAGKDGWGDQSISQTIKTLGIDNNVNILGYVKENILHALYQNCQALLMPSLYEGFGLPAIEALNYAKPVIATTKSAISNKISPLVINTKDESIDSILYCLYEVINITKQEFDRPNINTWEKSASITKDVLFTTS